MEIHELNTFSGTPGASDYLATDNGTDTSKIAIKTITDPINARIDNIITSPAPSEQEIIDARMGADGSVYDALGGAIRGQVRGIENGLSNREFNIVNLIKKASAIHYGVNYTWNDDGTCTLTGTATQLSFNRFFYETNAFPPFIKAGMPVMMKIESTNPNSEVQFTIFKCVNGALSNSWMTITSSYQGEGIYNGIIPEGLSGLMIRIAVPSGVSVNETIRVSIVPFATMFNNANPQNISFTDANDAKINGIYFISTGVSTDVANLPYNTAGWLAVECIGEKTTTGILQLFYPFNSTAYDIQWRTCQSGTWNEWKNLGSGGGGGTVIQNTYNITTSPHITTDTNGWLQPVDTESQSETGKTDMTGAIMSMLTDTGYCHLAKGIYYVSGNIDMPDGSTLEGCGEDTIIRLLSNVANGYCVKPTKFNTIKGIKFSGAYSAFEPSSSNIGTRNGVAFIANADGEEASLPSIEQCVIDNCWFENFNGSAIYCHNTGGSVDKALTVTNCHIFRCTAGINIDYYSEYQRYTNVIISRCYYACINNGGNNIFVGCTFHGTIGFVLGSAKNNAHGSCIGCAFNHIDSWNRPSTHGGGTAIQAINVGNGFIFTGCQIWYGAIDIRGSRGIALSDCLFGGNSPEVTVTGNLPAFFSNCIFHATPTLNVNSATKFDNCYLDEDGSVIGA